VADADQPVDYVVVGLGALGSAAAWHLAAAGHSVVGLEQFELGHRRGASHDTSRILRHSYHTPGYVRLTCEAYDDWARLEDESGERRLIKITASLGAAALGDGIEDMRELVAAADAALYRAKRAGKNQTVRAS